MLKSRNSYSADLKARVALEAIKGQRTITEIASHYGVHPNQIMNWKKQVLDQVPGFFSQRRAQAAKEEASEKAHLYQQIGQLKVELDWLKKKVGLLS